MFDRTISRAPFANLEAVEMLVPSGGGEQLALLGNDLYWLNGTTLMRAPKTGGAAAAVGTALVPSSSTPGAIVHADAGAVYLWTYGTDEDSLWVYKTGAAQPALMARVAHNFFNVPAVAGTASKLYVARPYAIFELNK